MAYEEAEIVRWRLSFKDQDHVLSDGTRRGRNREVVLVLQRARPRTVWWHTKKQKSWGGACPSKSETTYILMAHEEAEIMRWHLSFKEQDHIHTDGTRRGRNREVALVLQRVRPHTVCRHMKRPKSWGGACSSMTETTYSLMAHEEAEICEVTLVLQRARPRTNWWHTKSPKSWGGACTSKSETTYILMAHEEAKIVRWHLAFKEVDHVLPDGTRRGQNREVTLILQRTRPRTNWWHTKRPKSWGGTCPSKNETTYILIKEKEPEHQNHWVMALIATY